MLRAIAVPKVEADDARTWLGVGDATGERENAVDEAIGKRHVGVEEQQPLAAAKPTSFIDRTGEAMVPSPAP